MTLVALPSQILYPGFGHTNNSTIAFANGGSLTAAGHYSSFIFRAREAMAISHVYLRLGAVSGSPTAVISIESVDPATGLPSGTVLGPTANGKVTTGTLTTTGTVHALAETVNVAAGDYVCVKVAYNSGTSLALQTVPFARVGQGSLPYVVGNTGTPTKGAQLNSSSNIALGSSSTTFYRVQGLLPAQGASVTGSVSNATFDALGMRFKLPFKARCCGLITTINSSTYGEFKYGIYSDAGSEVDNSETTGFDKDMMGLQANGPHLRLDLDSPATLFPDTWYRAALWPTSATTFVLQAYGAPDANIKAIQPGGANWHYTRKAIGGAWDDSFVNDSLVMNLLIDQLDDGVGGGTSFSPLLAA